MRCPPTSPCSPTRTVPCGGHFGVTAQSTYLVLDEDGAEQAAGYLDDAELVDLVDGLVG